MLNPKEILLTTLLAISILFICSFIIWILFIWMVVEIPTSVEYVEIPLIQNNSLLPISSLPRLEVVKVFYVTATAYNPLPEQTDSTPFITASGERVRNGIVAANWFPFGTKLRINEEIYEVQDRMNKRYNYPYIDIFMWELEEAREFGRKKLKIELVN